MKTGKLLAWLAIVGSCACAQRGMAQALLPDSPGATLQGGAQKPLEPELIGTGSVKGVVLDDQGNPVPAARVTLTARGEFGSRTEAAGEDGSFAFAALPAEQFRVIVQAPGFAPFATAEFPVHAGEAATSPKVTLVVSAAATTVDVSASPTQIAEAQIQMQEKQRVLGVFPNFYTSYIWDAQPMSTKQKYKLAARALVDPFTILIVSGIAGAEHFNGTYPDYGPGIQGYGKRFGAALADSASARIVGSAVLPSLLHQDPRYFYKGSGTVKSRVEHAVAATFLCRGDNGRTQVNYSHLGGSLAAGAIANSYHPPASRGLGLTFETFGITTGANMLGNLFREFVLRSLEPSVPPFANGKH